MSLGMKVLPKGYEVYATVNSSEGCASSVIINDPNGDSIGRFPDEESVEAAWYHLRDNMPIDDFAETMQRIDAIMSEGLEPIGRVFQNLKYKLDTAELNAKTLREDLDEQWLKLLNERAKVGGLESALTEAYKYGNAMFEGSKLVGRNPKPPPWKDEETDEG